MRFVHEMTYDATPEAVAEMLADPAFREEVCRHQQVLEFDVTVERVEGRLTVIVDQVQQARAIPPFAQPFIGDRIEIRQQETWHSPTEGTLEATVPGKPAGFNGTITLRDDGDRTVETFTGEIKVPVPLIGSRIEELIGNVIRLALDAEYAVGARWLAEDRPD
jgi:Protein of unknown function (DUF2505)